MNTANNSKQAQQLNEALTLFQNNQLEDAKNILLKLTRKKTKIPLAWFLFGIINTQINRFDEATKAFKTCLKYQAVYPEAHNNLGVVLEKTENIAEAEKHYRVAIKQNPDYSNALYNLANILTSQRLYPEAIQYYKDAIAAKPDYVSAMNNLGMAFQNIGQPENAMHWYQKALELTPNDPELLNNMGYLLSQNEDYKGALDYYKNALRFSKSPAEVLNNLGVLYHSSGDLKGAKKALLSALEHSPSYYVAITNLANINRDERNYQKSEYYYLEALKIQPNYPEANNNYGILLERMEKYDDAASYFKKAAESGFKDADFNVSRNALSLGQFDTGWSYYTARPVARHSLSSSLAYPDKETLRNKNVLLTHEQGIGDELFFLRFVKELNGLTSHIDYLASPKMKSFAAQVPEINHVVDEPTQTDKYDFCISVADLPNILKTHHTPASVSLHPDPQCVKSVTEMLRNFGPPPYIGITWRAGQKIKNLLYKEAPINQLHDAVSIRRGTLLVLQRHPSAIDLKEFKSLTGEKKFLDLSDYNDDLDKMLALLSIIDEYIGVSNTNMHLRLALGKTGRVLVSAPAEWRWMFQGEESPWFPGFKIYRQTSDGNWNNAFSKLKNDILTKYEKE